MSVGRLGRMNTTARVKRASEPYFPEFALACLCGLTGFVIWIMFIVKFGKKSVAYGCFPVLMGLQIQTILWISYGVALFLLSRHLIPMRVEWHAIDLFDRPEYMWVYLNAWIVGASGLALVFMLTSLATSGDNPRSRTWKYRSSLLLTIAFAFGLVGNTSLAALEILADSSWYGSGWFKANTMGLVRNSINTGPLMGVVHRCRAAVVDMDSNYFLMCA